VGAERLVLVLLIGAIAAGCGRNYYGWTQVHGPYHVVEGGRQLELVSVGVSDHYSVIPIYSDRLVEPCERKARSKGLPCWPQDEREVTPALMSRLVKDLPAYRRAEPLLHAARYLNGNVGAFKRAYLIGTRPLAVAFLDEHADAKAYRALASSAPTTASDSGPALRETRLVGTTELKDMANVVLLFPDEMEVKANYSISPDPGEHALHAKLFVLSNRQTLLQLTRAVAEPGSLTEMAEVIVEVPVRSR
jgi:hypothetical protein